MIQTALITGASGGIGLELARIHASREVNLVLVARSGDKLAEIKSELESKYKITVYNIIKDLTGRDSATEVFNEVNNRNIEIDCLVNNAGYGDYGRFENTRWAKQQGMIDLNITALTHLTWLFIPGMISRGGGKILNVASLASFQPGPSMSVYFATKAFVLSFSEALSNELKDRGITVTALCPGSTVSKFHEVVLGDPALVKDRKMQSAEEVALTGYRAMMKGKAVAIPGFKNNLMVFITRFLPRQFVIKMVRKIQENKNYMKL